jgi:Fe-S-cluster-containing dehydrogenase component
MSDTRRQFLKVAALAALGAGRCVPASASAPVAGTRPAPSGGGRRRWGLVVDVARCLERPGCRACIEACHTTHNVPDIPDQQREVRWIAKEPWGRVFPDIDHELAPTRLRQESVIVTCNHCEQPPCVRVCPTQATWKRASDGIVMMDLHRCIGCRYCLAACPFGARNFHFMDPTPYIKNLHDNFPSATQGVVDKCNFCVERLDKGLLPACVLACQQRGASALMFGDLADPSSEVSRRLRARLALRRRPELGTGCNVFYVM